MDLVGLHNKVRNALAPFKGGALDGTRDTLADGPFHTFEMAKLLEFPRLAKAVLKYIDHAVEARFSTDRPTFMPMDEAAMLLVLPTVKEQWNDLLMEARKKSVSLGFFVHNLEQVFSSPLGPLMVDSCKTHYCFPNTSAKSQFSRKYYQQLGFIDDEITTIATMQPHRDIYYSCEALGGKRVLQARLSPFVLDCLARNTDAHHALMDSILQAEGREGFAQGWLRALGWAAATESGRPLVEMVGGAAAAGG